MADRRRQIQLLIGSRFDHLYFPPSNLKTSSGLVPAHRVDCPDCGHTDTPGWKVDSFKRRTPCSTCGGFTDAKTGRQKGGKGRVAVDPMDSQSRTVGATDTASTSPRRTVTCDSCNGDGAHGNGVRCERCDGTGRRDLHVFDLRLDTSEPGGFDPLSAAIDRRDQAGSYHELDRALAGISRHANKPLMFTALTLNASLARRLLDEVFLHRERSLQDLTRFEDALVELALAYVDSRMPDPIRVPTDVTANHRIIRDRRTRARGKGAPLKVRDAEIRKLAKAGRPAQWIAQEYGLSVSSVYSIVSGKGVAA